MSFLKRVLQNQDFEREFLGNYKVDFNAEKRFVIRCSVSFILLTRLNNLFFMRIVNCVSWRHVSSQENSADPASRGIFPSELVNNSLWFEGPSFLKKDPQEWPQGPVQAGDIPEMKTKHVHVNLTTQVEDDNIILSLIKRYSSLGKLQKILAYVLRFLHNTKFPNDKRSGLLTISELQQALNVSLKTTQQFHFREELLSLIHI